MSVVTVVAVMNNAQQPKDGETWILIIVNTVLTFKRSLVKKYIVNIDSEF